MISPRGPAFQSPPPLKSVARVPSWNDPVQSPRTPPPCRPLPWSPSPAQQETPLASWAEVAKVQSLRNDPGQFQTPTTACQTPQTFAQLRATPQPRVSWSYIASPSMEEDDRSCSPDAMSPCGAPSSSPTQPNLLFDCPTPLKTGDAFDWAAHLDLAPQGLFPFSLGAGFPWQAQDAPSTPLHSSANSGNSGGSPRTPGSSPFRLRSQLRSPPPIGLAVPHRQRSPSPTSGGPSDCPMRELLENDDPNLGRFRRDFCDIAQVARGQFSTVYRAQHRIDRHTYAVKVQTSSAPGDRHATEREVFALAAVASAGVTCSNLIRYYSSWKEDDRMHIQIELCESTLRCHMQSRVSERPADPRFGEGDVLGVLRQAANGLATLHGLSFVHLDVKPDNILFGRDGCYKLGDLGLATSTSSSNRGPVPEGDCRYLARELLQHTFEDLTKADVFSLGLVCYELAINPKELPQNGDDWQVLRDGCIDVAVVPHLSEDLVRLLRRMVHKTPSERPLCTELVERRAAAPADELEALRRELREAQEAALQSRELADRCQKELMAARHQMDLGIASLGA